jgi:hypothetical protein
MAIIATASANIRTIIIAVKIRGAAEGFRPRAPMLDFPQIAKTQQGAKIHKAKISNSEILRSIILAYSSTIIIARLALTQAIPRRIKKDCSSTVNLPLIRRLIKGL